MTDESNPGGQQRFSRIDFDALSPYQQGVVSYMQAAWNSVIPDDSPYPEDSKQYREWLRGRQRGVQIAQDGDDE